MIRLIPLFVWMKSPKQLIGETRIPIGMKKGNEMRYDYEYERRGMCEIFMVNEPLTGKRMTYVRDHRTKKDWAQIVKETVSDYKSADKITFVMDNLNTHNYGCRGPCHVSILSVKALFFCHFRHPHLKFLKIDSLFYPKVL